MSGQPHACRLVVATVARSRPSALNAIALTAFAWLADIGLHHFENTSYVACVLNPPRDFTDADLLTALTRHWNVTAVSVTYRAVGFGSHNWEVAGEPRWFAKVDEHRDFARIGAALRSATDVPFAVAPVPTRAGEPVAREGRFGVTLYPFVEGESFDFGDYRDPAHRQAALDMIVEVHRTPATPCARTTAGASSTGTRRWWPNRNETSGTSRPPRPSPRTRRSPACARGRTCWS